MLIDSLQIIVNIKNLIILVECIMRFLLLNLDLIRLTVLILNLNIVLRSILDNNSENN